MSVGGSIESVALSGRTFAVAADADSNRDLGGFTNEVQSNGDGTARQIKTRKPWRIDGLSLSVDDTRGDHEFLQDLANRKSFFPVTVAYASGVIYQGTGQIVDELNLSSQSTTAPVTLSGPGKLTKQ